MELADRVKLYNDTYGVKYPASVIHGGGGWYSAVWLLGNNYRNKSRLYGAYPPTYLMRVLSMFPDSTRVMHAFSGSLPPGDYTRVDIEPSNGPDLVCRVEDVSKVYPEGSFDLVVADPPYTRADSTIYGTKHPNKSRCIREIAKVLTPNGYLIWLDTQLPMYSKKVVVPRILIAIVRSTNHRVRLCTVFQRVGEISG
jgi:hypothetical protein